MHDAFVTVVVSLFLKFGIEYFLRKIVTTINSRPLSVMATDEEDNFIRIALLLNGICPRAVRHYFDEEFHPSCLENTMRQYQKTLSNLKTRSVINEKQWQLLYPRTGKPESKTFDTTLMTILLRNLASVPVSNHPVATDTSKGAALGTIKYYRNQLAHLHDSRINTTQFSTIWTSIEKAVYILGGVSMHEITNLKTKVLDRSNKEIMLSIQQSEKEIRDLKGTVTTLTTEHKALKAQHLDLQQQQKALEKKVMDPVGPNIRGIIKSELEAWKEEDKMFVETSSAKAILKCCIQNFCVTITGNSGMGKTATLRHVALQMAESGYDVILVHEPRDVLQYCNPEKKTLFVADDFCGKYSTDIIEINKWKTLSDQFRHIDNSVVKIIISCRIQVFQDELLSQLHLFKTCVCDLLSKDFKLTNEDLKSIANVFLKGNSRKILQYAHLYDCFPLLCSLCQNNQSLVLEDFFQSPFTVYEKELNDMCANQHYLKYCALALCVMFDNYIREEWLTEKIGQNLTAAFENTYEACGLNRGTSRIQIKNALQTLIGSYIKKEGNVYKTIHDKLFDFLSFYFGKMMITYLIDHANISWISARLIIDDYTCGLEPEFTVIEHSKYRSLLVNRLLKEWLNGQIHFVFYGISMTISNFRKDFFLHIQSFDMSQQNRLARTIDILLKTSVLHCFCLYGDNQWIKWCLDHGVDINMSNVEGLSPLHLACTGVEKHAETVQLLIENKADINIQTMVNGLLFYLTKHNEIAQTLCNFDFGFTPLNIVCRFGHTSIAKLLLQNDADINMHSTVESISPLFTACQNGHVEIVQMLLSYKTDINQSSKSLGFTPLYIACQNGHTEVAQILIDNKANINQCTKCKGVTPLLIACQNGHTEIVQILIKNNSDINQCTTDSGYSPLHMACLGGHKKIVRILVDKKAMKHQFSADNCYTPLHIACQQGHAEIVKMLLEDRVDFNQFSTTDGATPFHVACREGHTDIVQILLDNRAEINRSVKEIGSTPLFIASENGHTEIVQILLNANADINQCIKDNYFAPLHIACYQGHTEIVQELIEGKADINKKTKREGITPFHIACQQGHTKIVNIFLEKKADINHWSSDNGATPLHNACAEGHTEIVQLLLDNKADIDQATVGAAPLYLACAQGHLDTVKKLLDYKADINQGTADTNITPLFIACQNGYSEIVEQLLKHKANINKCTSDMGITPLYIACQEGHTEIVQILIDDKADVNQCAKASGFSPLHKACEKGFTETVQILVDNKADINKCSVDLGTTPLYMACEFGHTEIVQILLDYRADINQCTTDKGVTPLHKACQQGYTEIVERLIVNKADINQCTIDNGFTPLYIACQYGYTEIVKKLLKNKANINKCSTSVGATPLFIACHVGNIEVVQVLLEHNADINQCTMFRETPVLIACKNNHENIVRVLIDNKADINQGNFVRITPLSFACSNRNIKTIRMLIDNNVNILECSFDSNIKHFL